MSVWTPAFARSGLVESRPSPSPKPEAQTPLGTAFELQSGCASFNVRKQDWGCEVSTESLGAATSVVSDSAYINYSLL